MFLIINNLTFSLNSQIYEEGFFNYLSMAENILAGTFAVIFGFVADSVGRKRLAITGFILLGFGYGILAFIQNGNALSWILYTIADGIAWGAFYTIFLFTIWGDLAKEQSSEKFYALGSLPYLVSNFMRFTIGDYLDGAVTQITLLFSFASFFLFLSILPLIYAPETLPEKHIKERELKGYLEKAQKIAQKENAKNEKKELSQKTANKDTSSKAQDDKDYDEARKLAEKYY
jgi:MFS family permease